MKIAIFYGNELVTTNKREQNETFAQGKTVYIEELKNKEPGVKIKNTKDKSIFLRRKK